MASGKLMVATHFLADREQASAAAAEHIAAALKNRLEREAGASIVVSGGTTPVHCFRRLSETALDWTSVNVLLSDERWVEPTDADSNERLVRTELLQNKATQARLIPVFEPGATPGERCDALDHVYRALPRPLACTLLGMGADGHFASLFPDAASLHEGLDPDGERAYIPVSTTASPHPRISMTFPALCDSDGIVLLFFGSEKREVFERASASESSLPVSRLLGQSSVPVHVFWAE